MTPLFPVLMGYRLVNDTPSIRSRYPRLLVEDGKSGDTFSYKVFAPIGNVVTKRGTVHTRDAFRYFRGLCAHHRIPAANITITAKNVACDTPRDTAKARMREMLITADGGPDAKE